MMHKKLQRSSYVTGKKREGSVQQAALLDVIKFKQPEKKTFFFFLNVSFLAWSLLF